MMSSGPPDRRAALQQLLATSLASAGGTVILAAPSSAYQPGNNEARSRYRETDHVKAFYRTNGYETLKR
jgi:hypothetical protein